MNGPKTEASTPKLIGIMPTYRDLYPNEGYVGEKFIIRKLKTIYLRDCLVVLSQLAKYYFKYVQDGKKDEDLETYMRYCLELLDIEDRKAVNRKNARLTTKYTIIFPELSIVHLIKLCLKHCNDTDYTKNGDDFSNDTLYDIGKCLLVANSIFSDWQQKGVVKKDETSEEHIVNFTKQLIADKNFDYYQRMYQNYFIFKYLIENYREKFDIEKVFLEKYGVSFSEYFALLGALQTQFGTKDKHGEDAELPHLDFDTALKNLKPKFKQKLLDDFLINNMNYKKIDMSFFNTTDIIQRPLVKLNDGKIITLSLRRLYRRLTDSIYFDILDFIDDKKVKNDFSQYFGMAVEDYFRDIVTAIDKNVVLKTYGKKDSQEANDAIFTFNKCAVFIECKKKQFHTLEFLKQGNKDVLFERLQGFCKDPLEQICERIKDYRNEKFKFNSLDKYALIYPVVVYPLIPPIFSGAWDMFDFDKYVLPAYYKEDENVALPEFMEFSELEYIEGYLKEHTDVSFVDLIRMKREDKEHHNSNWIVFLYKNRMIYKNKRMLEKYLSEVENFKRFLFESATS